MIVIEGQKEKKQKSLLATKQRQQSSTASLD
jgi:hypothetical protein